MYPRQRTARFLIVLEPTRRKVMKIMHDQEIMDVLAAQFGEEATDEFGDCLSDFFVPLDPQDCPHETVRKMINRVNQALKKTGSTMRVLTLVSTDGEGYFWEVSE